MKMFSRFLWFGVLILVLATAACAPEQTSTPTPFETFSPGPTSPMTDTPFGTETTSTVETATGLTGTASPSGTLEGTETASTSGTAVGTSTNGTTTPGIPVTGLDVNLLDCQFCVDNMAHALLIMPDTSSFKVTSTTPSTTSTDNTLNPTCTTIEVSNGQQVVLCTGPETSPITINVCSTTGTCADLPVQLIDCPDVVRPGTVCSKRDPDCRDRQPHGRSHRNSYPCRTSDIHPCTLT
ncbi:MAG: hypothetical protein QM730_00365 [Anaerolineales bacterium]